MKYEELTGDAILYQYIVWNEATGWQKPKYAWYKLNDEKTWWLRPDGSGDGFKVETVKCWHNQFAFFNTEEEAKLYIRQQEYGPEAKEGDEDFCCPSCNRRFYGKDPFENDYFDDAPYRITCFCGEKLDISITTIVKYTVAKKKEKQ